MELQRALGILSHSPDALGGSLLGRSWMGVTQELILTAVKTVLAYQKEYPLRFFPMSVYRAPWVLVCAGVLEAIEDGIMDGEDVLANAVAMLKTIEGPDSKNIGEALKMCVMVMMLGTGEQLELARDVEGFWWAQHITKMDAQQMVEAEVAAVAPLPLRDDRDYVGNWGDCDGDEEEGEEFWRREILFSL